MYLVRQTITLYAFSVYSDEGSNSTSFAFSSFCIVFLMAFSLFYLVFLMTFMLIIIEFSTVGLKVYVSSRSWPGSTIVRSGFRLIASEVEDKLALTNIFSKEKISSKQEVNSKQEVSGFKQRLCLKKKLVL